MTGWTPEREQTLRRMVLEGASRSAIAAALGGVTRNAVIGKVHRLGLSVPKQEMPPSRRLSGAAQRAMAVRVADRKRKAGKLTAGSAQNGGKRPTSEPVEASIGEPVGEPIGLLQLTDKTCKWPVGEVNGVATPFCGARAQLGTPYCEHHNAKARSKSQPQGRTKPARRAG